MFEGCDRTGKSTFINYLYDELKIQGFRPYVFHLMGPTKFNGLTFTNDEKSLIQLAKFNDEYDFLREMIKDDPKVKIILDRTSFGEYIWTKYWSREGKYTDYVTSEEFIKRHKDLFDKSLYINFYMSDIKELAHRIEISEEDKKIFTIEGRSIEENIKYVYDMYEDLGNIIKKNDIAYLDIDSSRFQTPEDDGMYISKLLA